jgi:hypothetical protein
MARQRRQLGVGVHIDAVAPKRHPEGPRRPELGGLSAGSCPSMPVAPTPQNEEATAEGARPHQAPITARAVTARWIHGSSRETL